MSAAKLKVTRSTVSKSATKSQFDAGMLLAVVFLVMALLQLISFNYFKVWLTAAGFGDAATCAALIIIVEIVAALAFVRLTLPVLARKVSRICAVLASGFWFITNVRFVSDTTTVVHSSGFFGKYLTQSPSWWTVLEATLLVALAVYALETTKENA